MYEQSITRNRRTAFLVAIDQSGSMAEQLLFRGRPTTKAEAVAEVADALLFELIERARRSDGVRDYYDIAVAGYSGDGVEPLLGEGFVPVDRLATLPAREEIQLVERHLPDGAPALHRLHVMRRIAPRATGQTPMFEALLYLHELAESWCARPEHAASFPPIVFNITDGEASDCDEAELQQAAARIRSLKTDDGNVLLMNIHITTDPSPAPLLFPMRGEVDGAGRYARQLFEASSPLPALFEPTARALRGDAAPGPFRAMGFNASIAEVASMLDIGSVSIPIH